VCFFVPHQQAHGATFQDYNEFLTTVRSCTTEVPTGAQCCSSGEADCRGAGTTDMPDWDVSNILTMKGLFSNADAFKEDISRWDVSQVQSMKGMFSMASAFDADITSWDTISLVSSEMMFQGATTWHTKYQRKDGKEAIMGAFACSSDEGVPLPGDFSCLAGPPSAWRRRDLPPLPPAPPHLESPPPPVQTLSSPPPPFGNVPQVSPPTPPTYDPPTTSNDVGTVVLVAFIMLVIGFVGGYTFRLRRSNQGVPILDEEPEEESFERVGHASS
jgi:surface protein